MSENSVRQNLISWINPYVQDGLICHIDGIWKKSGGISSPTTDKPVDLTGGKMFQWSIPSYDIRSKSYRDDNHPFYEFGENVTFEDDAFVFNGPNSGIVGPATDQRAWSGLTLEIVFKDIPAKNDSFGWSFQGAPYRPMILIGTGFYYIGNHSSSIGSGHYFAMTKEQYISNRGVGYIDGIEFSKQTSSSTYIDHGYNGMTPNYLRVHQYGTNYNKALSGSSWNFESKIQAIRIYNRQLTSSEIAANYEIDKERFGI